MHTHQRLRAWRGDRTQKDIAVAAGLHQSALCLIERGDKTPSLEQAFKLQKVSRGRIRAVDWLDGSKLKSVRPLTA
jgi:DNA-binding XRE family transcriptional regulator